MAGGPAETGKKDSEIVVNLRYGAHSGPGILGCGFLLNGYGGREAFDGIHIRLVHALQKLACIGREGFHISALSFCIKDIEGERGLAGAGKTGDDHEPIFGDVHIDVLQIVMTCTAENDLI
jgi:hypothetical protein